MESGESQGPRSAQRLCYGGAASTGFSSNHSGYDSATGPEPTASGCPHPSTVVRGRVLGRPFTPTFSVSCDAHEFYST
jgi:hypothetical protein